MTMTMTDESWWLERGLDRGLHRGLDKPHLVDDDDGRVLEVVEHGLVPATTKTEVRGRGPLETIKDTWRKTGMEWGEDVVEIRTGCEERHVPVHDVEPEERVAVGFELPQAFLRREVEVVLARVFAHEGFHGALKARVVRRHTEDEENGKWSTGEPSQGRHYCTTVCGGRCRDNAPYPYLVNLSRKNNAPVAV